MTSPPSNWSEELQQQTRDAIAQLPVTADGCLHFKHVTLGYAYATYEDLCDNRLMIANKGGNVYHFDDADALLKAGWALD
jgi:hypothetical protein